MSLFRVNGQPIKFNLIGLDDEVFSKIKTIILENGGKVEDNDRQVIKFTKRSEYVNNAYPSYRLYDIKFIIDCKKKGRILNPSHYRIGTPMSYDDCLMNHFLHGQYDCCSQELPMAIVKTENTRNCNSDNHRSDESQISEDDSGSRVKRLINGNRSRCNENADRRMNHDSESETPSFSTEDDSNGASTSNQSRKSSGFRYSEKGRGQKISQEERNEIVKFLVENRLIGEALRGMQVWVEMINNGICANRTANSLYRHFRRSILPKIDTYNLTARQLERFKRLSSNTTH